MLHLDILDTFTNCAHCGGNQMKDWIDDNWMYDFNNSRQCYCTSGITDYNLQRFVDAQKNVYPQVITELVAGHKTSHWMWYIFPQLRDLGRSPTAHFYGISGIQEARAYLNHPLLAKRLRQCMSIIGELHPNRSALDIFGPIDEIKLRSCATLFAHAGGVFGGMRYQRVLKKYYNNQEDLATVQLLQQEEEQ